MVGVLLMAAAMTFAGNDVREGWEFRRGTTGVWSRVRIPHDATEEIRPRQSANLGDHGYVEGGVFQYRKAMPTPSGLPSGTRLSLHFDGVYFDSAVSVNGCHAGGRRSGYLPFEVELDPSRPTNVVEVTVDDRTPNTRWNPGAGILRSVSLKARRGFTLEPENVFARVVSADEARAELAVSVDDAELLVPAGGRIVIETPHLWSPEDPHLQDIRIVARGRNGETDELVLPYGIRTVSFTKDRGMLLNGRRYPIRGVCQHEGEPCFGAKLDVAALEYGMREMKKLGVNAIRTAHHPFPPEFYDLCDRLGFLVMDELFDQWREPKTPHGQSEFFEAEWRKDVETAVRRDRNHPSVILWSIGNEIPELGAGQYGNRHGHGGAKTALEMRNLIRTFDPTRPITAGLNGPKWAEDNGILPTLDVCGLNYGPEFYDLFRGKYALVGSETAATYSLRDVYCYRTNDAELVIANHDGNLAGAHSMIPVWGVPEQGQEATLKRQMSAPWSAGEFTWCSFDYLGEGSNPLSKGADHWPAVGSSWGMYDFAGLPKDRAYLYSAVWTDRPMAHLMPDWTLPGCEGLKVPVWCYTNCEEAELFLNGVSQGVRRCADATDLHLAWMVAYAPGVLRVEARRGGKTVATDERRTAGRKASIRKTVLFERDDEILVRYDAVDREGNRVISCEDEIELDGSFGELLAAANGSPLETTARRAVRRRLFRGSLAAWHRRRSTIRGADSGSVLRMMNVAHRGLWREANLPQNTVEAIRAAYDAGAGVVETDFVETESGELICIHDIKSLKSMSSVVIEPRKITPADRARINLGEKMGLPRPYRIPLLEEVLAVVPKDRVLQAEIKAYGPHYAVRFDAAVREAGLCASNVVVSSFRYEALKDFHAKFPEYRTLWLGCGIGKPADLDGAIVRAKAAGFDVLCPGCEAARKAGLVPADADKVRASGLDFRVFGVNSRASLEYAVSLRASGFTCDTFRTAYRWAAELKNVELQPGVGVAGMDR